MMREDAHEHKTEDCMVVDDTVDAEGVRALIILSPRALPIDDECGIVIAVDEALMPWHAGGCTHWVTRSAEQISRGMAHLTCPLGGFEDRPVIIAPGPDLAAAARTWPQLRDPTLAPLDCAFEALVDTAISARQTITVLPDCIHRWGDDTWQMAVLSAIAIGGRHLREIEIIGAAHDVPVRVDALHALCRAILHRAARPGMIPALRADLMIRIDGAPVRMEGPDHG